MHFYINNIRLNYVQYLRRNIQCVYHLRMLSTTETQKQQQQEQPLKNRPELTEYEPKLSELTKPKRKHPQRGPFMKNLFIGEFDTEMLGFPEPLNKDELNELNMKINRLDTLEQKEWTLKDLATATLSTSVNVFGLQSSQFVGGLELNETETCRILEMLATKCSPALITSLLTHQHFGVNLLDRVGNAHVQNKYLSKLSRGEWIAAFCLLEEHVYDTSFMRTNAVLVDDGKEEKHWLLNGKKTCVINGNNADVFIVVAPANDGLVDNAVSIPHDTMSVFVVDRTCGGITTQTESKTLPFQSNTNVCDVTFTNTRVPITNVLGNGYDSAIILNPSLCGARLDLSAAAITLLRTALQQFSSYTLHTKCDLNNNQSKFLSDMPSIQQMMAYANVQLYAIESLTYMTAGLLDRYENQDCNLETAIVKVFNSEKCLECIQQCMFILGSSGGYVTDNYLNQMQPDALGYQMFSETNEALRGFIALMGIQHAGVSTLAGCSQNIGSKLISIKAVITIWANLSGYIKKMRNPFQFSGFVIRKGFEQRRQTADKPKLNLGLEYHLHPSLVFGARSLEYCVLRLKYATETMLIHFGTDIVDQHMELKKLANIAIDIYTMVAVLSRASRAYCIGLRNADYEIMLANIVCLDARQRVKTAVLEITQGPHGNLDATYKNIAKHAYKYNSYFAEHPLVKNF